ncbi:MAG TPA: hypothetical protein VJK07_03630 [Candidatus Nanoarchaeia archaeon]|nr:hypothetical protein [Candidatus Nanoarchaeia archaeon]
MVPKISARTFKIEYLVNWYYGNLAYRFENCDVDIYHRIKVIASRLHVPELTHREFVMLMKENLGFIGVKKKPSGCRICQGLGLRRR